MKFDDFDKAVSDAAHDALALIQTGNGRVGLFWQPGALVPAFMFDPPPKADFVTVLDEHNFSQLKAIISAIAKDLNL